MDPDERAAAARERQAPGYIDNYIRDGGFESSVLESIPKKGGEVEDVGKDADKAAEKKAKKDSKKAKKTKKNIKKQYEKQFFKIKYPSKTSDFIRS